MKEIFSSIVQYLIFGGATTFNQFFILLGPGLILAFFMYYVSRYVERFIHELVGRYIYIYGFQIVGTPLHETGHAIFALLFRHKIIEFAPFKPNPATGLLGYVKHVYKKNSLYQRIGNFFIGIGPIVLGSLVMYLASVSLLGADTFEPLTAITIEDDTFHSLKNAWALVKNIYPGTLAAISSIFQAENLSRWQFYLFLYLALSIGTSINLSPSDVRGALSGFIALVGIVFIFNLATLWIAGDFTRTYLFKLSRFFSTFYAIMLFALIMDTVAGIFLFLLSRLKRLIFR